MSRHNDDISIRQMLDHAREAVAMAGGKDVADLGRERMLQLALMRLIEIIGEAAKRVSEEGRKKCPALPWAQIMGMRNRLIHGYDAVDLNLLRDTVILDLPSLIRELEENCKPHSTL